jgi:hypothetical protein
LEAKQRSLGASLAQVARHLGWDPGSLRRYLDGTWRISPDRRGALEVFLNTDDAALAGLHSLKRRRWAGPIATLHLARTARLGDLGCVDRRRAGASGGAKYRSLVMAYCFSSSHRNSPALGSKRA